MVSSRVSPNPTDSLSYGNFGAYGTPHVWTNPYDIIGCMSNYTRNWLVIGYIWFLVIFSSPVFVSSMQITRLRNAASPPIFVGCRLGYVQSRLWGTGPVKFASQNAGTGCCAVRHGRTQGVIRQGAVLVTKVTPWRGPCNVPNIMKWYDTLWYIMNYGDLNQHQIGRWSN
jgi:hypothetical protein